jgi:ubiquitin C-terminal hydrolase
LVYRLFLFHLGVNRSTNDFNNDAFDKNSSKTICPPQNESDCITIQQCDASVFIDPPVMNWNMLRKQMIGLTNKSSTACYINSALQCFASTPPLVKWLFDHLDKLKTCKYQLSTVADKSPHPSRSKPL